MASNKSNRQSRAFERIYERIADNLVTLDRQIDEQANEDIYLMSITINTPWKSGDDYLVIARAQIGAEKVVAFHGADTIYEALTGFATRFSHKQLTWKEDKYAQEKS